MSSRITEKIRSAHCPFNFANYTRPFLEPGPEDLNCLLIPADWNLQTQVYGLLFAEDEESAGGPHSKKAKLDGDEAIEKINKAMQPFEQSWQIGNEAPNEEIVAELDTLCNSIEYSRNGLALARFGQFFESRADKLRAHSFFRRAIAVGFAERPPSYAELVKAVDSTDNDLMQRVQEKNAELCFALFKGSKVGSSSSGSSSSAAPEKCDWRLVLRDAYYRHIFHTCRMEGNELSLEEVYEQLKEGKFAGISSSRDSSADHTNPLHWSMANKTFRDRQEVIGAAKAFAFVLEQLQQQEPAKITPALFIRLNELVLEDSCDEKAGQFFFSRKLGPSPSECSKVIRTWLDKLADWVESEFEAHRIDRISLAALAHSYFVTMHPFEDGNGRTARAIMNLLLMRAGFPPIVIPAGTESERDHYMSLCGMANGGDQRPFIRFVARHLLATTENFLNAIILPSQATIPPPSSSPSPPSSMVEKPRGDCMRSLCSLLSSSSNNTLLTSATNSSSFAGPKDNNTSYDNPAERSIVAEDDHVFFDAESARAPSIFSSFNPAPSSISAGTAPTHPTTFSSPSISSSASHFSVPAVADPNWALLFTQALVLDTTVE